jgi:hypothetical protein
MTFEQRPEGSKGENDEKIWKESTPNRQNGKCKCPEVGFCLECSRNQQETSVTGAMYICRWGWRDNWSVTRLCSHSDL